MASAIATNPLTFNSFLTTVGVMAVAQTTTVNGVVQCVDASLQATIPQMLNYAELRISRDADLLSMQVPNSYSLPSGTNILQIPVSDYVTVQTLFDSTNSNPLLPVSKEFLQNVYGSNANAGPPQYFAMAGGDLTTAGQTYTNIMIGPWSDQSYPITTYGTIRMPSLYNYANQSQANTATTFISTWMPDLLLQAACIFISQEQRNFGIASSDPQMGNNFEGQYQTLLKGVVVEEMRRKFAASAWSSMSPATIATPTRGA